MRVLKEIVVNYRNRTMFVVIVVTTACLFLYFLVLITYYSESEKDFKREKVVFTNLALNENGLGC